MKIFKSVKKRVLDHNIVPHCLFSLFLFQKIIMETKNIDGSWYSNFFVDHYMNMINEQRKNCHRFSVDFLLKFNTGGLDVVKRNIKQTINNPLLSYHTLIFSILKNNQWTIATADTEKYRIMYYDRFGRDDETITSSITKFLQQ